MEIKLIGADGTPSLWREGEIVDGRYKVVRVAGRGQMGEVYQVRHLQWDVSLAVKIPRTDFPISQEELGQFEKEAQNWVSLGLHPNVCSCYFVRQMAGIPVVFAEYVPDESLYHWITHRRLYEGSAADAVCRIVDVAIQFAWGLAYAHRQNLIHQDVKPANVLIDLSEGDLTVKITDFGLARAHAGRRVMVAGSSDDDATSSVVLSMGGLTPAYASPEQAGQAEQGGSQPLSESTDIYSYAVSLLEILTGKLQWDVGSEAPSALVNYRESSPAAGIPAMPPKFVSLLEWCLAQDPAQRPPSMAKIAEKLAEIYQEVSGSAYPRHVPDAANLMAGELNNRALSMLDLGDKTGAEELFDQALTADPRNLAATYNSGLLRWRRGAITDIELVAEIEAMRTNDGESTQVRDLLSQVHMERGDLAAAHALLTGTENKQTANADGEWQVPWPSYTGTEAVQRVHPDIFEVARKAILSRPQDPRRLLRVNPRDDAALAITPDGRLALTGTWDGKVRLWEVHSGRCLKTLDEHRVQVHAIDLTANGRFALTADEAGVICFWDLWGESGSPVRKVTDPSRIGMHLAQVTLSPEGSIAFWATANGRICGVATGSGERLVSREQHAAEARSVRVSPLSRWVMSSGWELPGVRDRDDTVRVWDTRLDGCRHILRGHSSWVTAMAFSADEDFAVTGSHDRTIRVWDLKDGTCVCTMQGHTADSLSLSDDMRYLLSGDAFDGTVRLWDVASGQCLRTFPGHKNGTTTVHFHPGGHAGFSIGNDRTVRRWNLPQDRIAPFFVSRPRSPRELTLLDSRVAALASDAEQAMLKKRYADALSLLREERSAPGYERHPQLIRTWRTLQRHCTPTRLHEAWSPRLLTGHTGDVIAADISPDGQLAVSGGIDGTIRVWDPGTGTCMQVFHGHGADVLSVCLSPDGQRLLSSGKDGMIRLWIMQTGQCVCVLESAGRVENRMPVKFAADGQQAVVADPSGDIRIWDLATGHVRSLRSSTVKNLSIAADGRLAAFARGDKAQLWDLRHGIRVRSLSGKFLHSVHAVCLSANGGLALTAETGGIRLWDTVSEQVLRTFSGQEPLSDGLPDNEYIAMTADGRFAISAGYRSFARVWDLATGERVRELDGHERGMTYLAMTPDGSRLVCGTRSGVLRVWELDWELTARETGNPGDAAKGWTWDTAEKDQMEVPGTPETESGHDVEALIISSHLDEGRLVMALDNPDLARYIVIAIPAIGSVPEHFGEFIERAEFLRFPLQGMTNERVSVITWLDYTAPQSVSDARDGIPAAEGGARLAQFIAELRVRTKLDPRRAARARITVIGYGYGGLVAGYAARDHILDVNALVFLGSASAGVSSASDLHCAGMVYATSPDAIGDGTPEGIHGPRPDSPGFGAKILHPRYPPGYGNGPAELAPPDPVLPYLEPLAMVCLGVD